MISRKYFHVMTSLSPVPVHQKRLIAIFVGAVAMRVPGTIGGAHSFHRFTTHSHSFTTPVYGPTTMAMHANVCCGECFGIQR
jgi:hypothetical protein